MIQYSAYYVPFYNVPLEKNREKLEMCPKDTDAPAWKT